MENMVKAVGATFAPKLHEDDWQVIEELRTACYAHEAKETFFPFFQNCGVCRGFVFGRDDDVQQQHGVCGCVVAMEVRWARTR